MYYDLSRQATVIYMRFLIPCFFFGKRPSCSCLVMLRKHQLNVHLYSTTPPPLPIDTPHARWYQGDITVCSCPFHYKCSLKEHQGTYTQNHDYVTLSYIWNLQMYEYGTHLVLVLGMRTLCKCTQSHSYDFPPLNSMPYCIDLYFPCMRRKPISRIDTWRHMELHVRVSTCCCKTIE